MVALRGKLKSSDAVHLVMCLDLLVVGAMRINEISHLNILVVYDASKLVRVESIGEQWRGFLELPA